MPKKKLWGYKIAIEVPTEFQFEIVAKVFNAALDTLKQATKEKFKKTEVYVAVLDENEANEVINFCKKDEQQNQKN